MALFEKIIAKKNIDLNLISPGQIVEVDIDFVYLQDGNIPTIAKTFHEHKWQKVFNPDKIACFIDHGVLSCNIDITNRIREAEAFAEEYTLKLFKAGEGISHVIAMEIGIYCPHSIILGADSHTCTGGAVQCLSLGMGATDIVFAMLTGKTWLKIPETQWLETIGMPGNYSRSKDVVLFALKQFQQQPFLYKSIEWYGNYVNSLSLDSMSTLANLSVEQGAKCAFFPKPVDYSHDFLEPIVNTGTESQLSTLDISSLPPFVSKPHLPFNACPFYECGGTKIDYVFIGSCANSRLEDLADVATVLKHNKVHNRVKCVITAGSKQIFLKALERGFIEIFLNSGVILTPPGCGSCVGTQGIIPADGDVIFSTMNRNFKGRMGNAKAQIYLGSPLLAAYVAVLGYIPDNFDLSC